MLARELDGRSAEQVAAQLGVSVNAAQMLAARARENLVKTRTARDADCDAIRPLLADAHERGARPTEHALRHVRACGACRAHQRDLRRLSRKLHAISPGLGIPLLTALAKLLAGGGAKAAVGTVVAAVVVATTGAVVVLRSDVHAPGDPAPFRLLSAHDSKGRPVTRGTPIPEGHTVVTARVRIAGSLTGRPRTPSPTVTLPCPKQTKLYSLEAPNYELPATVNFAGDETPGYSTGARLVLTHGPARPATFTIAIACRRPDAYGSVMPDTSAFRRALRHGERRLSHVCAARQQVQIRTTTGGPAFAFAWARSPVAIQARSRSRAWTRIVSDDGTRGWVKATDLCG